MRALLEFNAPLDDASRTDGRTALVAASIAGWPSLVSLLLDAGADPDVLDADDRSALLHAASRGHVEVVRVLIDAGAELGAAGSARPDAAALAELEAMPPGPRAEARSQLRAEAVCAAEG